MNGVLDCAPLCSEDQIAGIYKGPKDHSNFGVNMTRSTFKFNTAMLRAATLGNRSGRLFFFGMFLDQLKHIAGDLLEYSLCVYNTCYFRMFVFIITVFLGFLVSFFNCVFFYCAFLLCIICFVLHYVGRFRAQVINCIFVVLFYVK